MSNPLTTDTLRAVIPLHNPSSGGAYPRAFAVKDVTYEVVGPDGQRYDFPHAGQTSIPVDGLTYNQTRSFPLSGTYQGRPVATKLDGTVRALGAKPFVIALATVRMREDDDGSLWAITSYSDGRASTTVMIEGPLDVDFGGASFA